MLHLLDLSDLIILAAGPLVVWSALFAATRLMRLHSLPAGSQENAPSRGAPLSWNGPLAVCLVWMACVAVLGGG